jgi:CRISPR/Cas system-associated exonuclease Cas4 (RecB family)
MELACGDNAPKHLQPLDFPAALDPKTCQLCQFRKLCWGTRA